jgi:hypothetical protein
VSGQGQAVDQREVFQLLAAQEGYWRRKKGGLKPAGKLKLTPRGGHMRREFI